MNECHSTGIDWDSYRGAVAEVTGLEGKRVYIAAPYTLGDVAKNVNRVIKVADELVKAGYIPYIPHLTHFWHLVSPKEYDFWLEYDHSFIDHWAQILLRLDGDSDGADGEARRARELGLPVYYSLGELLGICREFKFPNCDLKRK